MEKTPTKPKQPAGEDIAPEVTPSATDPTGLLEVAAAEECEPTMDEFRGTGPTFGAGPVIPDADIMMANSPLLPEATVEVRFA